jgi:HEAT repeat protein
MQLLALLQKPLPRQAPASMRSEAWSDLQLWTQLGAWAEQRHTWALHTKLTVSYMGFIEPPTGMVAPYPEFFAGLAALSRRTATAFEKAGFNQPFDIKTAATNLLEALNLVSSLSRAGEEKEFERNSGKLEQLGQFQNRYYGQHKNELEKAGTGAWKKLEDQWKNLAQRCAATGKADAADAATLRLFYDCRQDIGRLLNQFVPVCDRLAELAKKPLTGQVLTEEDAKWIEGYGVTLATFHFYYGNSYEVPRDNFPIITRVFSNPLTDSMLYAGLARPQALYVIASDGKTNQLYRGAVMTYREFVRPNDQLLDDDSWRELVARGQTPPAPPFTRSFCVETSVPDLLKKLHGQSGDENLNYGTVEETIWQIGSRATSNDLPQLLKVMTDETGRERWDVVEGMAEIIARLPWEPFRKQLIEMLAAPNQTLADAAAHILIARPGSLNQAEFISAFKKQPVRTRRLYCALLGRLPDQTETTRTFLLEALQDQADGVRWQAVLAIKTAKLDDAQSTSSLVACFADKNELVGAAAAWSLGQLGATNTAPELLAALKTRLKTAPTATESRPPHVRAIVDDLRGEENHADPILNVDNLAGQFERTVPTTVREMATMRLPPMLHHWHFPAHNYDLADALIGALGDLGYAAAADELFKLRGTDYDAEATRALSKLAPERLASELLATAKDKQIDSYLRERALVTLCHTSGTNHLREIVSLLDDVTPIVYSRSLPGPEWRICDRAAVSIAVTFGWEHEMALRFVPPDKRDQLIQRAREWAKATP